MTFAETILLRQPWLITPDALRAMAVAVQTFTAAPSSFPSAEASPLLNIENGVGVIDVSGPLIRKPDIFSQVFFGATDTEYLTAAVREAASRPDVEAIFLDIDSPGGSVTGIPELAQAVADAGKQKPVYAFSSGQMCSAAYWMASQAQAIYATPSAQVGSIGVLLPMVDDSEAFKNAGIKVEVFAAGKFKGIGLPGVSLTDDQRAHLQSNIAEIAGDFHDAVLARGRKIPPEAMEGQAFSGKQAQRMNLAGVVQDRADAMNRLRSFHVAASLRVQRVDTAPLAMKTVEEQLNDALARVQSLETDAKASASLLTEASVQTEALKIQVTSLTGECDQLNADLVTARRSIESISTRNKELEASEQDIEKRASLRAAQIVASTGTQIPAKVTPAGDNTPNTGRASLAEHVTAHKELVKNKKPKEAAAYYEAHIAPLLKQK